MTLSGVNTLSFKGDALRSSLKKTQERTKCFLLEILGDTGVNYSSPQGLCSSGELAICFCLAAEVYWCDLRSSWKASHTGLWTWHLWHLRPCPQCWRGWWSRPGWPRSVRWEPPGALQGWCREPRQLEERVRIVLENLDIHPSVQTASQPVSQHSFNISHVPGYIFRTSEPRINMWGPEPQETPRLMQYLPNCFENSLHVLDKKMWKEMVFDQISWNNCWRV